MIPDHLFCLDVEGVDFVAFNSRPLISPGFGWFYFPSLAHDLIASGLNSTKNQKGEGIKMKKLKKILNEIIIPLVILQVITVVAVAGWYYLWLI